MHFVEQRRGGSIGSLGVGSSIAHVTALSEVLAFIDQSWPQLLAGSTRTRLVLAKGLHEFKARKFRRVLPRVDDLAALVSANIDAPLCDGVAFRRADLEVVKSEDVRLSSRFDAGFRHVDDLHPLLAD